MPTIYILIISCSQRKRTDPGLLPAIERYAGPTFQVLCKARREGYWPADLHVLILSAEFGLIETETAIPLYDRRMTPARAVELQPAVSQTLSNWLPCRGIFVNLSRNYLLALPPLPLGTTIYASGRSGQRSAQMKSWLQYICTFDVESNLPTFCPDYRQ